MKNDVLTAHQVAEEVQAAIARHPLQGTTFRVWEDKIAHYDDWWRVPLVPSPWPERLSPIYEVLAEIEGDIQDDHGMDVLLSLGEPASEGQALVAVA